MLLRPFAYHRPESLAEVHRLMGEFADEASLYAGGTELLLLMKLGLAEPSQLIDIKHVHELGTVTSTGDELVLGATVTHARLGSSPEVRDLSPELAGLFATLANPRVRHTGTIGGNLCFADPHSDPSTLLISLGAVVELRSAGQTRRIGMDRFAVGAYETAREENEVLTSIRLPMVARDHVVIFERMAMHQERPVVNAALTISVQGAATLVVGALTERPVMREDGVRDAVLSGQEASWRAYATDLARTVDLICPEESMEYHRNLFTVMVMRAFRTAATRLERPVETGRDKTL